MRIDYSYDGLGRYCDICKKPYLITNEGNHENGIDFCDTCFDCEECENKKDTK